MAGALALAGGLLGLMAGALAPTEDAARWAQYLTPPPSQRLISFNGNALYLLGANGRIYACVDRTRKCQMVAAPAAHDVAVGCGWRPRTPAPGPAPNPPTPNPPAPGGTRSLIYVSWCGAHSVGIEFFALLDNGGVWRLSQFSSYHPERRFSNSLESGGLGAVLGLALAVLLALGLGLMGWRRPIIAEQTLPDEPTAPPSQS